jgi:hypothetical protein
MPQHTVVEMPAEEQAQRLACCGARYSSLLALHLLW